MVNSSDYRLLVILSPLLSPMVVSGGSGACLAATRRRASVWNSPISNSRPRTEARAGVVWGNQKRVWKIQHKRERAAHQSTVWHNNKFSDIKPITLSTLRCSELHSCVLLITFVLFIHFFGALMQQQGAAQLMHRPDTVHCWLINNKKHVDAKQ